MKYREIDMENLSVDIGASRTIVWSVHGCKKERLLYSISLCSINLVSRALDWSATVVGFDPQWQTKSQVLKNTIAILFLNFLNGHAVHRWKLTWKMSPEGNIPFTRRVKWMVVTRSKINNTVIKPFIFIQF